MARITVFLKKNILNFVIAIGVLILSILVSDKLSEQPDFKWWAGLIFFICLYLSSLYEITVKEGKKNGYPNIRIFIEILCVWVIPILIGYVMNI
jgi:hypothetical protein